MRRKGPQRAEGAAKKGAVSEKARNGPQKGPQWPQDPSAGPKQVWENTDFNFKGPAKQQTGHRL